MLVVYGCLNINIWFTRLMTEWFQQPVSPKSQLQQDVNVVVKPILASFFWLVKRWNQQKSANWKQSTYIFLLLVWNVAGGFLKLNKNSLSHQGFWKSQVGNPVPTSRPLSSAFFPLLWLVGRHPTQNGVLRLRDSNTSSKGRNTFWTALDEWVHGLWWRNSYVCSWSQYATKMSYW